MPGFKKGVTGACIVLGNLGEEVELLWTSVQI